jgi:hypothetical protein
MSVPESGADIHIARPNINFSKSPPSLQAEEPTVMKIYLTAARCWEPVITSVCYAAI